MLVDNLVWMVLMSVVGKDTWSAGDLAEMWGSSAVV